MNGGCSQLIFITLQSRMFWLFAISNSSLSVLWTMDLAFVRKMLGSGGLKGCFLSRASSLASAYALCVASSIS